MDMTQMRSLSRRHFIMSAGLTAAAVTLTPRHLLSGQENLVIVARRKGGMVNITTQALRGNVSALIGSGGNIAVLTGTDGKLLVDSGYAGSRAKISEALNAISHDPIKHLVNTHWHFDHTDGNEWMHAAGAIVSAHKNTTKHLTTSTRVDDWDFTFPPSPAGAIPGDVFDTSKTLRLNEATIVLKYYGPAHTDGDVSAYFMEADVFHTGDTWWNGHFPFIDYSTGGNIDGMIRAAETNIAAVSDKTIVIPGHGSVGRKADLVEYRNMLMTIRDRVATLKKEGRSLEEVIVLKPTAAYDAKWAGSFIDGKFFTRLVYRGV
jgi:glyoxylase-like metal-dependent hydrolase (beta-lactamase superfamily II)